LLRIRARHVPVSPISEAAGDKMSALKIAAIALIVAGVLGLAYGGFSYTKETHSGKLGPIELSITERQTVNIPLWAGVGAIVIGGALLIFGLKGR
jgi:TRAP-type C4-dicarboxylate transport system permease small subunit